SVSRATISPLSACRFCRSSRSYVIAERSMAERHAFVCGHPVRHSRSPLLHDHWLQRYGIAGRYRAIDVAPKDFPVSLGSLASLGLFGGNITIPHKQAALSLVDEPDEPARRIGAVNTVWLEDGR